MRGARFRPTTLPKIPFTGRSPLLAGKRAAKWNPVFASRAIPNTASPLDEIPMLDRADTRCLHRAGPKRACVSCAAWLSSLNETDRCWPCGRTWTEPDETHPLTLPMREAIGEALDRALEPEVLLA